MPKGTPTTECQCLHVLRLLRQSKRPTSQISRGTIPRIANLHRHTVSRIIEQAAIKWLEIVEAAERLDDLQDRGR